jgi:hypothetical protein
MGRFKKIALEKRVVGRVDKSVSNSKVKRIQFRLWYMGLSHASLTREEFSKLYHTAGIKFLITEAEVWESLRDYPTYRFV